MPRGKTVYVMSDRELDDYTIHNAIISELQKRGHRVVDAGDKAPASAQGSLVLITSMTGIGTCACISPR
jgi:hypothetical protein